MMKSRILAITGLLAFLLASPRQSDAVPLLLSGDNGLEGLGSFEGTLTYTPSTATLVISLTNTSPAANGGFLTAFALNNPDDKITGISLSATDTDFGLLGTAPFNGDDVDAQPFGHYDFGASNTSDWLGGGSPTNAIGVGQTATFTFSLTGTTLNTLTEESFVGELPSGMEGECCDEFMVVRFRGFDDEGSDKVPTDFTPIPEPSALFLLGVGMVGIVLWRRRQAS